ncbi:hypothetical protein H8D91_00180 [archaeon]|nr:hypothetical protein [archaeon]
MTEAKHNIDELGSKYPALGQETLESVLKAWDQEKDLFLLPTPNRHSGELEDAIVGHDDVYSRFCHQPKNSSPEEIEVMVGHNKQLLSFLTDICGWDETDPFRPDPESIRRGY